MRFISRKIVLSCLFIAVAAMTAHGQGRGGGPGGGFGGGRGGGRAGGFGGINPFGGGTSDAIFATRGDVSKELNLSSDQISEIRDLQRDAPNMFRLIQEEGIDFRAMRDMSEEERAEAMAPIAKRMAEANEEISEEVFDILKTSQKARFRELKFQYELSRGNLAGALTAGEVKLDKNAKEDLEEARSEVNKELQKRIEELRKELYMAALDKAGYSESEVEDMMGKAFSFTADRGPGGGRQRRGDAGGRGGRQRGGDAGGRGGRQRGGDDGGRRRGGDDADDDNPRRRQRPN